MKKYLFLLLFLFIIPISASATDQTRFSITPGIIEKKLDPGTSSNFSVSIANPLDTPLPARIYVRNFRAADKLGGMTFDDNGELSFSANKWIKPEKENVIIEPKKTEKIRFLVNLPREAEPGGHYATIFFEPLVAEDTVARSKLGVVGRVGALVFLTVNGEIVETGQVKGARSDKSCNGIGCSFFTKRFVEGGPIIFNFDFENTGNVHTSVKGKIDIYNTWGQKAGEVAVSEKTVLPQTIRHFEEKWSNEMLFGRYKANLKIEYGSSKTTDSATITFWVVPWKLILLLMTTILFLVGIMSRIYLRKRKKSA